MTTPTPTKCRTCAYAASVNVGVDCEMLLACTYIIRKGQKRPCPAGDGCTVYEPRRRGK